MSAAWITLSYSWNFADAQATLNIIISLLGTIAIWTFSRLWYQHSSSKIIRQHDVSFSSLFTFTSLGEALDILRLLKGRLLEAQFLPLLAQTIVVFLVTVMTILSGPIARYSLRSTNVLRSREVPGLLAATGNLTGPGTGPLAEIVSGNVLWNTTIESLNEAGFPTDQLLDFLPSSQYPWTYQANEWNSTWHATCNNTEEKFLNITGNINYTIDDPINAFPEFGATFDQSLVNASAYRYSVDFCGWIHTNTDGSEIVRDIAFFVLLTSEPTIDDQLEKNENPLHLSLSVLHIHNASLYTPDDLFGGRDTWRVDGPIQLSSYTRTECELTRDKVVPDENFIAWPWTNDTDTIVQAYADYNRLAISEAGDQAVIIPPLSPHDIFRFYQAYQISFAVLNEYNVSRPLSVELTAIQLSIAFLVVFLLLFVLVFGVLLRYLIFRVRHKSSLEALQIPDAKLDWMMHAFKHSKHIPEDELVLPERDQFKAAAYEQVFSDAGKRSTARVFSRRQSEATLMQRPSVAFGQPELSLFTEDAGSNHSKNVKQLSTEDKISNTVSVSESVVPPGENSSNIVVEKLQESCL